MAPPLSGEVPNDEELIAGWLAPYAGSTRAQYARLMHVWMGVLAEAGLGLLDGDRARIEAWGAALLRSGMARTTVAAYLGVVCGFYRWCWEEGHLPTDVGAHVRRPSRPRRSGQRWLEAGELRRLLDAARDEGPTEHAMVCMLGLNGLRIGEAIAARIEHLGRQGDRTTLLLPSRKAGVMDRVGLPERAVWAIGEATRGRTSGLILRTGAGGQFYPAAVYRVLDQLAEDAGIAPPLRPHMLRATFITLSLDAGVPVRDVMASAGHMHATMVSYYDRAYGSVKRNASGRLADWLDTQP
ncbi:tyrosine-type recombinase/integrase [Propionibacterium australiense]|uniref:tyrosine-type recombinase/integrase n=1 Tax=Propionibacterium australiense TaxID=119981 RepID=UPI00160448C2|nr:site-specific integrase [Propionibacterium australiense]